MFLLPSLPNAFYLCYSRGVLGGNPVKTTPSFNNFRSKNAVEIIIYVEESDLVGKLLKWSVIKVVVA